MTKIYLLAPLGGLLVFGAVYWRHARLHEMRLTEIKRLETAARLERNARQQAAQAAALEQVMLAQTRRREERAAKERLEEAQHQARTELEQRRNTALEAVRRLRPQLEQLRRDLENVNGAIGRSAERTRELEQEQRFLTAYVEQAEANQRALHRLLEKAEAIERQRATPRPAAGPPERKPSRT